MRNSHTLTSSPARSLSHCWKNVWEVPSFPARPVRPILMGVTYVIIRLYGQFEQCVRAGHLFQPDQSVQSWSGLCNYLILCTFRKYVRALRGCEIWLIQLFVFISGSHFSSWSWSIQIPIPEQEKLLYDSHWMCPSWNAQCPFICTGILSVLHSCPSGSQSKIIKAHSINHAKKCNKYKWPEHSV